MSEIKYLNIRLQKKTLKEEKEEEEEEEILKVNADQQRAFLPPSPSPLPQKTPTPVPAKTPTPVPEVVQKDIYGNSQLTLNVSGTEGISNILILFNLKKIKFLFGFRKAQITKIECNLYS
jgi:hypothetical protein